ncbi:MAG TPA: hypothetical protein P5330_00780 [Candidatus Competibacteraceae bacterium]|nr:hypothetical protein [Candidatus Competibacteraceae bacterium]
MQKAKEAVIELVRACGGLTHAALADEAGINRGQLTAWLAGKRPLSDQRVRSLVKVILGHATNPKVLSQELQQAYARRIDHLRSFLGEMLPVSGGEREVPVDGPLPVGHPAFCKRECEEELERLIKVRPFTLGIKGGRKTGKSTAARWLADRLKSEGSLVLYFDFSPFTVKEMNPVKETNTDALFAWLDQQARDQLPETFLSPLRNWRGFVSWIGENLLRDLPKDDRYPSLFFDGVENLDNDAQKNLLYALQSLRNAKAHPDKKHYRYINLFCVFDPSRLQDNNQILSGGPGSILVSSNIERASNIDSGQLVSLVQWRLGLTGPQHYNQRNQIADHLWLHFAGHPWLTQSWLNACVERAQNTGAIPDRLDQLDDELSGQFGILSAPRVVQDALIERLKAELSSTPDTEDRIVATDLPHAKSTWSFLENTGLFFPGEDNATLYCTRWVARCLVESARS